MILLEKQLLTSKSQNEKYKEQIKSLKKQVRDLNHCVCMIKKHINTDSKEVNRCSCCSVNLDGWIYYKKGLIKICHFCYKSLEMIE